MYSDKPIKEYLKELASRNPVPGGGSAAALVGAIGAALLNKVANFTIPQDAFFSRSSAESRRTSSGDSSYGIGKEKYKNIENEIKGILKQSEGIRKNLVDLCSKDARAYKKLRGAFELPKGQEREKKIQVSLKEAISVPLEVCKKAHEAIKLCKPLAEKGNVNLITDVGDAALILECAFKAALLNVEINLKGIKDDEFVDEIKREIGPIEKEIETMGEKVKEGMIRGKKG